MTGALLYQPKQSWRVELAFVAAAALIHFAAVAIAGMHHQTQVEVTSSQEGYIPVDFIAPDSPMEEPPAPPPEDVPAPATIPIPVEKPIFDENTTTPSPVRRQISKPTAPIVKVRTGVNSGTLSLSSVRAMALSGPRPIYPYEARRQRITGSGIAMMTVDPASGNVIDVVMQESTGSAVLDNAAVTAFRRWRFKPNTVSRVKSPITFTMTGAQY